MSVKTKNDAPTKSHVCLKRLCLWCIFAEQLRYKELVVCIIGMNVCGCSQMRLFSLCLLQNQMVCVCSSRNRAHTDWWESSALSLKWNTHNPSFTSLIPLSLSLFLPLNHLLFSLQLKMTTTRSSGDIATDLTEICTSRISKLSSIESKDHLIMASNGSLISAGKQRVNQLMTSAPCQIDEWWYMAIIFS